MAWVITKIINSTKKSGTRKNVMEQKKAPRYLVNTGIIPMTQG